MWVHAKYAMIDAAYMLSHLANQQITEQMQSSTLSTKAA